MRRRRRLTLLQKSDRMRDRLDTAREGKEADQEPVDVPIRIAEHSSREVQEGGPERGYKEGEREGEELGALESRGRGEPDRAQGRVVLGLGFFCACC